jgi:hypothetical protein
MKHPVESLMMWNNSLNWILTLTLKSKKTFKWHLHITFQYLFILHFELLSQTEIHILQKNKKKGLVRKKGWRVRMTERTKKGEHTEDWIKHKIKGQELTNHWNHTERRAAAATFMNDFPKWNGIHHHRTTPQLIGGRRQGRKPFKVSQQSGKKRSSYTHT